MVGLSLAAFAFLFCAKLSIAQAEEDGIKYLYPTPGLTFNYLDTINVTYSSPYKAPKLYTYCLRYNGGDQVEKGNQFAHPGTASSLILIAWTEFVSCHFTMIPNKDDFGNRSTHVHSPWFRITAEARPTPVLWGLEQGALSNTSTPIDESVNAPSNTPASTPTATPEPSGGLSSGAKIGIGVGVGLGVLFLLAAFAGIILMRRRKKARNGPQDKRLGAENHYPKSDPGSTLAHAEHHAPVKPPVAERPNELPSEAVYELESERIGELNAQDGVKYVLKPSKV